MKSIIPVSCFIFLVPGSDEKSYWEQLFYYYAEWSTYKNQIIILLGHVQLKKKHLKNLKV